MSDCPYCAEPIEADEQRCPSCGEHLGEERYVGGGGMPTWVKVLLAVLVLLFLSMICLPFFLFMGVAPVPAPPPPAVTMAMPGLPPLPPAPAGAQATAAELAAIPIQTTVDAMSSAGTRHADRVTYSWGGYGITDLGRVRIAVVGLDVSGLSSSDVTVAAPSDRSFGGGSTGVGPRRFASSTTNGVTAVDWGQLAITIQDSVLMLGPVEVSVDQEALIVVEPDGSNPVLHELLPPPGGG